MESNTFARTYNLREILPSRKSRGKTLAQVWDEFAPAWCDGWVTKICQLIAFHLARGARRPRRVPRLVRLARPPSGARSNSDRSSIARGRSARGPRPGGSSREAAVKIVDADVTCIRPRRRRDQHVPAVRPVSPVPPRGRERVSAGTPETVPARAPPRSAPCPTTPTASFFPRCCPKTQRPFRAGSRRGSRQPPPR